MSADLQMSFLWGFTWIWALRDYSLCKDYCSNPSQSQLMVWLSVLWDKWLWLAGVVCSQSVWKIQSGRLCGEFHQPTDIAGGRGLFELQGRSLLGSVGPENLGSLRSWVTRLGDPVLSESYVLSPVKWSGVCPEGSMLMGVCSVI